jgi:hypothetical protein
MTDFLGVKVEGISWSEWPSWPMCSGESESGDTGRGESPLPVEKLAAPSRPLRDSIGECLNVPDAGQDGRRPGVGH